MKCGAFFHYSVHEWMAFRVSLQLLPKPPKNKSNIQKPINLSLFFPFKLESKKKIKMKILETTPENRRTDSIQKEKLTPESHSKTKCRDIFLMKLRCLKYRNEAWPRWSYKERRRRRRKLCYWFLKPCLRLLGGERERRWGSYMLVLNYTQNPLVYSL